MDRGIIAASPNMLSGQLSRSDALAQLPRILFPECTGVVLLIAITFVLRRLRLSSAVLWLAEPESEPEPDLAASMVVDSDPLPNILLLIARACRPISDQAEVQKQVGCVFLQSRC